MGGPYPLTNCLRYFHVSGLGHTRGPGLSGAAWDETSKVKFCELNSPGGKSGKAMRCDR